MDLISASGAVAVLLGAAADGYVDTKFALKADGTERSFLGFGPGVAAGVVLAGLGLFKVGGHYSGWFTAIGAGFLAGEAMRYSATRTVSSMQQSQGTQGLLPGGASFALPQAANMLDLEHAFDRVQGLLHARAA